jgi:hypothetical protein
MTSLFFKKQNYFSVCEPTDTAGLVLLGMPGSNLPMFRAWSRRVRNLHKYVCSRAHKGRHGHANCSSFLTQNNSMCRGCCVSTRLGCFEGSEVKLYLPLM